jgi:hypothetical protein
VRLLSVALLSILSGVAIAGCSSPTGHTELHARPAAAAPIAAAPPPEAAADAAVTTPCAAMPVPVADASPVELDLNGDHIPDHLIPVECNGTLGCAMAVVLTAQPCPVALGRLGVANGTSAGANGRRPAETRALSPLTSHGIALVRTEEDGHDAANTSVWAWDGTSWLDIFRDDRWWGRDRGEERGLLAAAGSACLDAGTPTASFDLDGDGVPDGVYAVPCVPSAGQDDQTCGNWVTLARSDCRVPVGVLASGTVTLVQSASAGHPALLKVTGGTLGRGRVEYRFDVQRGRFGLAASRSCPSGRTCEPWKVASSMDPEP